jgi:hypothetical protein
LADYSIRAVCGFSRLEFKRVVIQGLGCVLRYVCETGSIIQAMQRARAVRTRRADTLGNILSWVMDRTKTRLQADQGDDADRIWAVQAESYIRNAITSLWIWFDKKVDHVADQMKCQRGREGPKKTHGGAFDLRVQESQCKNRECNNANFFRVNKGRLRRLATFLRTARGSGTELTDEIEKALAAIEAALKHPDRLYDYNRCLALGDVWIHLECVAAGIRDFATTNYKESQHLCPAMGLNMKLPQQDQEPSGQQANSP